MEVATEDWNADRKDLSEPKLTFRDFCASMLELAHLWMLVALEHNLDLQVCKEDDAPITAGNRLSQPPKSTVADHLHT